MPVTSNDLPFMYPSITVTWIDFPPSAEGLRSTRWAGLSSAVSSTPPPSDAAVAGRRVSPVPGQIIPPSVVAPPGALIPPGAGGRPGGFEGGRGFSLRISHAPVLRRTLGDGSSLWSRGVLIVS